MINLEPIKNQFKKIFEKMRGSRRDSYSDSTDGLTQQEMMSRTILLE